MLYHGLMSDSELQLRLIYSMIVAGKSAKFADGAIARLFVPMPSGTVPFEWIKGMRAQTISRRLKEARTGNYSKLAQGVRQLVTSGMDLRTCLPSDLEKVHGIGPKTSRFFLLWTRPGIKLAALDVHVLRWLKKQGHDVPKSTPASTNRYAQVEQCFLKEAQARGMTPRELDSVIWDAGAKRLPPPP